MIYFHLRTSTYIFLDSFFPSKWSITFWLIYFKAKGCSLLNKSIITWHVKWLESDSILVSYRSLIQIATRVFDFVLPPPPAPEDSPSPSSPSTTRHHSPSIDITSVSPDSSVHSPITKDSELPPIDITEKPSLQPLARSKPPLKSSSKKRKKPGDARPPPPAVMPPRPQFTYAQLCYKAICAMEGKATLQDICCWVSDNFDWYRYNEGSGWEVRWEM